MKKILLLGGGYFQIPSIKKAKDLGYYTITCDYLPNNPGHKYADEYYNVSTTDKESVLKIAEKLKIDGIVSYASDVSAPTAAYVAEKLNIPGHPYESVEILTHKDLFRDFMTKNGFNVPRARGFSDWHDAKDDWENFKKPVMVKPVDSSGSKGVKCISEINELENACLYALSFSRLKRFIVEEYISKSGYQVDGDGFSIDGKLVFPGYCNQHNDLICSPYAPTGSSFPYHKDAVTQHKLSEQIQKVFDLLRMRSGAYNIEARYDENELPYLLEIGPRNGGNLIPQIIQYATGFDMVEATLKVAVGEKVNIPPMQTHSYVSSYLIHSSKSGVFKGVEISESIRSQILEFDMVCKVGDKISSFVNSNGVLGTLLLKFDSLDEMLFKMDHMVEFIKVYVD